MVARLLLLPPLLTEPVGAVAVKARLVLTRQVLSVVPAVQV